MPRIGETLREARMRRQVDIGEVEQATKIRAKYLRALENEEFDLLPGPTFVRSFLKTYAEHLGLDARMLVEEFRAQHEGLPEEDHAQPAFASRPPQGRSREPVRYERPPISTGWIVGGAVAALLVLFLILGLTGSSGGGTERSGSGAAKPTADRGKSGGDSKRKDAAARKRRRRPTSVILKISPSEPTYLCVDRGVGQTPLYEGSLSSARIFRGKRLRINLGRPSAKLRANGRAVSLGSQGQSVGLSFSPGKRARPLALGQRPCA